MLTLIIYKLQLTKVSPKTDAQFLVPFDSSTFTDTNNQELSLAIQMQNGTLHVPDCLEMNSAISINLVKLHSL
jgi:hypothetical protein